jgi:hypothetical protein
MRYDMTKEETLLKFLREEEGEEYDLDDIAPYGDNEFIVNERQVRHGTGPREIERNAVEVRKVLACLFPTVKPEKWLSSRVNERVYRILDRRLKAITWPEPHAAHDNEKAKRYQYIVNFFYHLYCEPGRYCSKQGIKYQEECRRAFDTGSAEEYRELMPISDYTFLVLTDEEADEMAAQSLRDFADESLEIPSYLVGYVDKDKFVSDVLATDGRAMHLASYDHIEHEVGEYYIYRTG